VLFLIVQQNLLLLKRIERFLLLFNIHIRSIDLLMVDEVILNIVYHPKNIFEVILILTRVPERKEIISNKSNPS
jgi:hypothetical protein